ncbi:hypothetical protein TRAPUB_9649 [Trametes pubescens]|uniref:Uncharacterized protein n=1 Tax=Trametes pubescens TaxID=154538 RepID=A0A1M2W214_TRAPU|nr:hypothetical protein TRAPUB_9649 [Trametes pubescens]
MILPDDTPESPTKSRAGPPSEAVDEDFIAPPPAYPGNGNGLSRHYDVESQAGPSSEPLLQPQHHVEQVEPAPQRFFKALGIAVLIWLVGKKGAIPRVLPVPQDGTVELCVPASSLTEGGHIGQTASFQLPLSADLLYIFGRGALSRGSITFTATTSHSIPRNKAQVNITPIYESSALLSMVNFCHFERVPGEIGVGILTPKHVSVEGVLEFAIDVQFPVIPGGGLLQVKAFETDLPMFSHHVKRLEKKVRFESISLFSRNMPIQSDYLSADEANIVTSNAKLSGTYHASRGLFLKTSNADISTEVTLYHDNSAPAYTNLTFLNSNGAIDSQVNLRSTSMAATGGSYDVLAHTANAHLDLRMPIQAVGSTLALDARTSNAPATVHLSPAYEGTCLAETTLAAAEVECNPNSRDPAGLGRTRVCALPRQSAQRVEGWASWDMLGKHHGLGEVSVVTSNTPARLYL